MEWVEERGGNSKEDLEAWAGFGGGWWRRARAGAERGNTVGVMKNGRELRTCWWGSEKWKSMELNTEEEGQKGCAVGELGGGEFKLRRSHGAPAMCP